MTTNMGILDRGGRLAIAAVLLTLALGTSILGAEILFWLALIVAAIFSLTAITGKCPLYRVVGLNTCRDN